MSNSYLDFRTMLFTTLRVTSRYGGNPPHSRAFKFIYTLPGIAYERVELGLLKEGLSQKYVRIYTFAHTDKTIDRWVKNLKLRSSKNVTHLPKE